MIFVEAPTNVEQMRRIACEVNAPTMANNIEGGKTPFLPAKELEGMGYSVVAFAVSATYAMTKAVGDLMAEIFETGTSQGFLDRMVTFETFNDFIGLPQIRETEQKYYGET
jgi:methylisocitrate lyase